MSAELNTTPIAKSNNLLSVLSSTGFKSSLQQYLPKHCSAERLSKIVLSDVRKNPKLLSCEKTSFLAAVSQIASLGLEPGVLGNCYLLPFDNYKKKTTECQLIIGYRGMIDLIFRSGKVATIQAHTVDEKDEFSFNYGRKPDIYHVPSREQSGNIIYVYAAVTFKDESFQFVVMTMDEVNKIKACSKGANNVSHPWNTWAEEMMKKTALKRLFKLVPISIEVSQAIAVDESESVASDFLIETEEAQETLPIYDNQTDSLIEEIGA